VRLGPGTPEEPGPGTGKSRRYSDSKTKSAGMPALFVLLLIFRVSGPGFIGFTQP